LLLLDGEIEFEGVTNSADVISSLTYYDSNTRKRYNLWRKNISL